MSRAAVLAGIIACAWASVARSDGGTLRLWERLAGYQIAVFTSPTPLRVGVVDISVLVQDADTGTASPDAQVRVRAARRGLLDVAATHPATTEAATNKLFLASIVEMSEPGVWEVEIQIEGAKGSGQTRFALQVGEPLPRWLELWPWIGWPALVVALFGAQQVLVRRKASGRKMPYT